MSLLEFNFSRRTEINRPAPVRSADTAPAQIAPHASDERTVHQPALTGQPGLTAESAKARIHYLEANGQNLPNPTGESASPGLSGDARIVPVAAPQAPFAPPDSVRPEDAVAILPGEGSIESYEGELPSPFRMIARIRDEGEEWPMQQVSDSEIRQWVKDAADHHGVPPAMLATILQQENGPNATEGQKAGQFAERTLTTGLGHLDRALGDVIPDQFSKGSSGLANMSYETLQSTLAYHHEHYSDRAVVPPEVADRLGPLNADTGVPGSDTEADFYYAAAHLRQLIDEETGQTGFDGSLTMDQAEDVFASYNGSGPLAEKYGRDARGLLEGAMNGSETLYFYER